MAQKQSQASAYSAAVRLLGMREHSRSELRQKLATRGYESGEIEEALDRLTEQDYLNDSRFAQMVFRQYSDLGRAGAQRQMERRGLDPGVWEPLVAQIDADEESSRAFAAASKKAGELPADLRDYDQVIRWKRRAFSYLMRRGFSAATATSALTQVLETHGSSSER